MKATLLITMIFVAITALLLLAPRAAKSMGERLHDAIFAHMHRSGLVLGMAEIVSRQAAAIAAGDKMTGANFGKVVMVVITSPATAAWAQNDTIASGLRIPVGARPLAGGMVSCAAMGAGVTLDVGLRNFATGVAVDADGIASAIDVSGATVTEISDGALVAAGVESVTTVETELYATLGGGNPTDDAQIRIEVPFLFP